MSKAKTRGHAGRQRDAGRLGGAQPVEGTGRDEAADKDLVRRWQEAYNTGDLEVLDEILAPAWTSNAWPEGVPQTVEGAKAGGRGMPLPRDRPADSVSRGC